MIDKSVKFFDLDSDKALLDSAKLLCNRNRKDLSLVLLSGKHFQLFVEDQQIVDLEDHEQTFTVKCIIEKEHRKIIYLNHFILIETKNDQTIVLYKFIPEKFYLAYEEYFFLKAISFNSDNL